MDPGITQFASYLSAGEGDMPISVSAISKDAKGQLWVGSVTRG